MITKRILKDEKEFRDLVEMLIQDANSAGSEAEIDEEDAPSEYPCLASIRDEELPMFSFSVEEGEEELDEEEIHERMQNATQGTIIIYEMDFLSQREVKELLNA